MIYDFLLYWPFRSPGGAQAGKENSKVGEGEGESDPGRARWFAYSPLHNPVAVIHHASAVCRSQWVAATQSAAVHSHGVPVPSVSHRHARDGLGGGWTRDALCPQPILLARGFCLPIPFSLLLPRRAASEIFSAEGIHDRTIAQANLHPWNPRQRGQRPTLVARSRTTTWLV